MWRLRRAMVILAASKSVNRGVAFAFGRASFPRPYYFQTLRRSATGDDSNGSNNQKSNIKPTWTYTPYQPPKPSFNRKFQQRYFSDWTVPKSIDIPEDQLEISFSRSSGSGGQNVNKLNTKVELRFHLQSASWIPKEVRDRLQTQQANRINKEGFLTLSSQEFRTQGQNRKDCLSKLEAIIIEAYPRPKIRKQRKGLTKKQKERRLQEKKKRSEKKSSRGKVDW
jgi:peptidyl-tRNA hydrolase ICT1